MTPTVADVGLQLHFGTSPPALWVAGEIDMLTTPFLSCALLALGALEPTMVVDVSQVTFMDGRGARALAEAATHARRDGGKVIVRGASAATLRLLRITGVVELVQFEGVERAPLPADANAGLVAIDRSLRLVTELADATFAGSAGMSITLEQHGQPVAVAAATPEALAGDGAPHDDRRLGGSHC